MHLHALDWGSESAAPRVCLHGVAQRSTIFESLAERLASRGDRVLALDLRGHGQSAAEPPWGLPTHVSDVVETTAAHGVERAVYIGHSYGAIVATQLAATSPQRVAGLVLLDPPFEIPSARALAASAILAQDWSFETVAGAVQAVLASDAVIAAQEEVVAAYVESDLRVGSDGRHRFGYQPNVAAAIWREMAAAAPPIAQVPTLVVRPTQSFIESATHDRRYGESLGRLVQFVSVPGGHNVLWESPEETTLAIEAFLAELGPSAV